MSTITFQCYACNQVLRVGDDKAGKKAKCIGCGTILTIPMASTEAQAVAPAAAPSPAAAPPPARRRDEDDDRPRRRDDDDDDRPRRRDDPDDRDRDRRRDDDDRPRRRRDEDDDDRGRRRRDEDDDRGRGRKDDDDRDRRRGRDDDDDDRGRRRRDDDDDRGRGRRDDDDDDRGRRKRDDDDYDDRDRGRKEKSGKADWGKISLGMMLAFIGYLVIMGGYGLQKLAWIILDIMAVAGGRSEGMLKFLAVLVMIGMIVMTLGLICAVVGKVFWVFTNNKNGALALGISALAAGALTAILYLIFGMIKSFDLVSFVGPMIMQLSLFGPLCFGDLAVLIFVVLALGGMMVVSALYLRSVGLNLRDRYLTTNSMATVIMSSIAAGYLLISLIIAYIVMRNSLGGLGITRGSVILFMILQLIEVGIMVFTLIRLVNCASNAKAAAEARS